MRKSTFAKIAYELSWLKEYKDKSRFEFSEPYADEFLTDIEDTLKMVRQAVEEDTQCVWEQETHRKFLHCSSIEDGEKLYDKVMEYSYNNNSSRGITLQQMLYEEIIDHNSIVSLWEKDDDDPHYSNLVWKGEFWKLPSEYENRVGQIHGVMSDPKDIWGDDVHVELLPKVEK